MALFVILILSHNKEGVDISMRKDITIEKILEKIPSIARDLCLLFIQWVQNPMRNACKGDR